MSSHSPRRNHAPKAVLFDHDGVLVASEPLHWAAWGQLLVELGLPYHESELRALVGKTAPQILGRLLDLHRPGWSEKDYDLDALALRKNDIYLKNVATGLQPYPGVLEGLQTLKARGIRTAVVSNAKRRELDSSLKHLKMVDLFDIVISRDDVPTPKPDPYPYLAAAAHVGIEPRDCVAVEDSPPGMEAALLAKIPLAAVLTNFPRAAVEQPVPGRADLAPEWIGQDMLAFFEWVLGAD